MIDEPNVPYKQITQAYWADSSYTIKQRLGLNLSLTYNSSRSGMRPDVNPNDAALLGNASLISQGAFDQTAFGTPGQPLCPPTGSGSNALCNLYLKRNTDLRGNRAAVDWSRESVLLVSAEV